MLKLEDINVSYGNIKALHSLSFAVAEGKIVSLIGANGAGKTTTLKTISGLLKAAAGKIEFKGMNITNCAPPEIVEMGISQVPEGRHIFPFLTVKENLKIAGYNIRNKKVFDDRVEMVFNLFPKLRNRVKQSGGTLSGGEQQMLAIARALVTGGELMLFDEPSMGLAPNLVEEIFEKIREINRQGTTILLVEQNAKMSIEISDYVYVLEVGNIALAGTSGELRDHPRIKEIYLGG